MANALDPVNLTQELLNAVTDYLTNNILKYLGVGTGNTAIALTTEDVDTPVSIASGVRNLVVSDITTSGNFFKLHFVLTAAMPVTQPSDLQQLIMHDAEDDTTDAYAGWTLRVAQTKDSDSQWDIWISGKVVEIERV